MLMTIGATIACEIVSYLVQIIIFRLSINLPSFIKIILIETLYNAMITIIIYPLIEKAGDTLEKVFKGKSILTKYY